MKYILKRMGAAIATLLVVSIVVFTMFKIIPGDVVTTKLGVDATPERAEALREKYGLNDPAYIQYINWLIGIVSGNLGMSYSKDIPVSEMNGDNLVVTLSLAIISLIMIIVIAVPLGLFTGYIGSKKNRGSEVFDGIFDGVNQVFMAVPSFFIGILISYFFGLILRWFSPGRYVSYRTDMISFLLYLIPAAVAVAIPKIAMLTRFVKTAVKEEMYKDYVRTARAKGVSETLVLVHHVFKNSIITSITALSVIIAEIFAGSVVVEQVFNLPGLGRLLVSSIGTRDYTVVMSIVMYIAIVIVMVNLLVDIVYRLVDPRIGGNGNE